MGVVNLLFVRDDVNPDKQDTDGGTPLWWASYNRHEGLMKLLLTQDGVNPDKLDRYGESLLW